MTLSPEQHKVLVHCCGFDMSPKTWKKPYRNYYCVDPGQDGYEMVEAMVAGGYMTREKGHCFVATSAGVTVARLTYESYLVLKSVMSEKEVKS